MTLTGFLIGFGLVLTGAFFFGYPLGHLRGRRAVYREIRLNRGNYTPRKKYCRDVLDAQFLEDRNYVKHSD